MILEWTTNTHSGRSDFAFPLFVLLWVQAVVVISFSVGVVRTAMAMRGQNVPP